MARKKKLDSEHEADVLPLFPRPRLRKLRIANFRCIGPNPVEVELDDIVVLVGPNNAGKSAILKAYELIMSEGSRAGDMQLSDFPGERIDPSNPPTIELETVVFDEKAPGEKWVFEDPVTGELVVRERWQWPEPGKPIRAGWDVTMQDWHPSEKPWGAPNVAQAARPEPHYIDAFASPETQAKQITDLLTKVLAERFKEIIDGQDSSGPYQQLVETVKNLRRSVIADVASEISEIQNQLSSLISEVFPGYTVAFDPRTEEGIDDPFKTLFTTPQLRMGPVGGYQPPIEKQGSGARRTLLWTALKILAEENRKRSAKSLQRPHLLLLDEPEICLHPTAIREACRVLYDLPQSGNWQVMVTTHSPQFIDLSRDNTSIVRVERDEAGQVHGTTLYRPRRAQLDEDDRTRLKLLNVFDPYVAEFFFGGRTILVEGDTEYTAFMHLVARYPEKYRGVHIVRARGKATLVSLAKILNQFGKPYAVLHDSDRPFVRPGRLNPAWNVNKSILSVVQSAPSHVRIRLVASVPNFEEAFLGSPRTREKPYEALMAIQTNDAVAAKLSELLDALIDFDKPLPERAVEWDDLARLEAVCVSLDSPRTDVAVTQEE